MSQPATETCLTCGAAIYHDFTPRMLFEFKPLSFEVVCQGCQTQFITNDENTNPIFKNNAVIEAWLSNYRNQGDVRQALVFKEFLRKIYKRYRSYEWVVLPELPDDLLERGFHPAASLLDQARIPYLNPFALDQTKGLYIKDGVELTSAKEIIIFNDISPSDHLFNQAVAFFQEGAFGKLDVVRLVLT